MTSTFKCATWIQNCQPDFSICNTPKTEGTSQLCKKNYRSLVQGCNWCGTCMTTLCLWSTFRCAIWIHSWQAEFSICNTPRTEGTSQFARENSRSLVQGCNQSCAAESVSNYKWRILRIFPFDFMNFLEFCYVSYLFTLKPPLSTCCKNRSSSDNHFGYPFKWILPVERWWQKQVHHIRSVSPLSLSLSLSPRGIISLTMLQAFFDVISFKCG